MRASQELVEALNNQIGNETLASLQYTTLAAYFDAESLLTLSRFYRAQADEERVHAMKFVDFVMEIGAPMQIPAIPAPQHSITSAEEAVRLSLTWEQTVTAQIHELYRIASEDHNLVAQEFLRWFIDEQQEEESVMSTLLGVVRRAGEERLLEVEGFLVREGWVPRGVKEEEQA